MGNSLGGIIIRRKRAKVMKISGETFKLKTPAVAADALKDHPGHVLLESEAVKHFGVRAKPLDPDQRLRPKKLYFLVELPKLPEEDADTAAPPTRRTRSCINMSAKDRLECLMLSRRSVSDMSMMRRSTAPGEAGSSSGGGGGGPVRVKVRLPRAQVEKLVEESKDEVEVAEKIIDLYLGSGGEAEQEAAGVLTRREVHWKPGLDSVRESLKGRA